MLGLPVIVEKCICNVAFFFFFREIEEGITVDEVEELRKLKFRGGFVARTKTRGQKKASEPPNHRIRQ